MKILKESSVFTRRQFLKGSGVLVISAVFMGIFAKVGFDAVAAQEDVVQKRVAGLYSLDEKMTIRKSHENPEIIQLYKDFLSPGEIKPVSDKAHHLLHTRYGEEVPGLIAELKKHPIEAA